MESGRPEATDRQTVAEVLRDGRELARAAKTGEALAAESFPTFLDAIAARVQDPPLDAVLPDGHATATRAPPRDNRACRVLPALCDFGAVAVA